jgi:hypothetical protein
LPAYAVAAFVALLIAYTVFTGHPSDQTPIGGPAASTQTHSFHP